MNTAHRTIRSIAAGTALLLCVSAAETASAGWFEKATGYRTSEPIRRIAPRGISIRPRGGQSVSGSSSSSSVDFMIRNQWNRRVYFQVRTPGGTWKHHQLDPGRSTPFRFEVWGGYGSGGTWSDAAPLIQFDNAIGAVRRVRPRHHGIYVFRGAGNAVEMSW